MTKSKAAETLDRVIGLLDRPREDYEAMTVEELEQASRALDRGREIIRAEQIEIAAVLSDKVETERAARILATLSDNERARLVQMIQALPAEGQAQAATPDAEQAP